MDSFEDLIERTRAALERLGVDDHSRLLLGVSGGIDSMSLATTLMHLLNQKAFSSLKLVHVNHQLRGEESLLDESLVRDFAAKHDLPFESHSVQTAERHREHRESIELAARNERYRVFAELCDRDTITHVLTAHTADDQFETVLMNLLRGAGLRGLGGIPPVRSLETNSGPVLLVRPWLDVWRREIVLVANEEKIPFREDSSNSSLQFFRNRVRHELVPFLTTQFHERDVKFTLHRMSGVLREEAAALEKTGSEVWQKIERKPPPALLRRTAVALDLNELKAVDQAFWHSILLAALHKLFSRDSSLSSSATMRVQEFILSDQTTLTLNKRILFQKEDELLIIESTEHREMCVERSFELLDGFSLHTPVGKISLTLPEKGEILRDRDHAYFDHAKLKGSALFIRPWKSGDRIRPFGMQGTKLVSDLLNERGVRSKKEKERVPVIVAKATGEILWIPGVRACDSFKVTEETADMLCFARV